MSELQKEKLAQFWELVVFAHNVNDLEKVKKAIINDRLLSIKQYRVLLKAIECRIYGASAL